MQCGDLTFDAWHFERDLAEEYDVRAQTAAAGAAGDFIEIRINGMVFDGRTAALAIAAGFREFAVHVDQIFAAGALVQVVDILRAEKEAAPFTRFELGFEFGEGDVRGIGRGLCAIGAALGVKLPNQCRIAAQSLGRANLFDVVSGP